MTESKPRLFLVKLDFIKLLFLSINCSKEKNIQQNQNLAITKWLS